MGVDHNAYIGPYLRVTEAVTKKKVDRCAAHNFPADAEYCPKCGTSKGSRYTTEEVSTTAPEDWQWNYRKNGRKVELHDYLYTTSIMSGPDVEKGKRTYLYLPNRYYKEMNIPKLEGGKYSEEEVPFENLDVPATLEKFKELFADEIAYLSQWFQVELKYGYVSYCS